VGTLVSRNVPGKADVTSVDGNKYKIQQYKRLTNARYILNYLQNKGWSHNAIHGLFGNIETESFFSPATVQAVGGGYGLVQWTPASKYKNADSTIGWAAPSNPDDIDNQLNRIALEAAINYKQWNSIGSPTISPTMTFTAYSTSPKTVNELASYFYSCYEQPNNGTLSVRQTSARKWSMLVGILL